MMNDNSSSSLNISTLADHMVTIPRGEICMRDDRVKRQWIVAIEPFLLCKYPVTQELYYELTQASPSVFEGKGKPVETVSWQEAASFCNALSTRMGLKTFYSFEVDSDQVRSDLTADGYRLPTEAEWEYACKAGSNMARYGDVEDIAWYKGNSLRTLQNVGLKEPNPWGLYDMLGNVWEWCSDIYDETIYGSYRILRGGGWSDVERGCMATNRRRSHPKSFRIDDLGFRLARNMTE